MLQLIPIQQTLEENSKFQTDPGCEEVLRMTLDYYKIVGFNPPWIGYLAKLNGVIVGSAGYKGKPVDNKVEIAYGTLPSFRGRGIGTEICRQLVLLARKTDPAIIITARTLPENNHSTGILRKNNFRLLGTVWDKDDGNVWEWLFEKKSL